MEIRRTFLLMALAAVSYFLFLSWQKDYGQQSSQPVAAVSSSSMPQAGDMPAVKASSSSDMPAVQMPSASKDISPAAAKPQGSGKLIHVQTDVLKVEIDPAGGDIVGLALPAYTVSADSKQPFALLTQSPTQTYIAQSGLVGASHTEGQLGGLDDRSAGRPVYTVDHNDYRLDRGSQKKLDVVLSTTTSEGVTFRKIFHFVQGDYRIGVEYEIENRTDKVWQGSLFGQLKRDSSKDPSAENHSFGMVTFLGGAWWTPEKSYNKVALGKFAQDPVNVTVTGGWAAMVQHYFVAAWIPDAKSVNTITSREGNQGQDHYIGFTSAAIQVQPHQIGHVNASFYAGPKIQDTLKTVSSGLELTVDYGWLWPIAQFLFWLLKTIHGFLGNWGWSIVMLTVMVKGAFFHLSATSYRSMAKMRKVMPEMQRMKEQYGNDRAKLSQAMMELYKKEKINPLGGCLPILVQMPVFIALYWTLMESVELRHAGWILWINDLSKMDPYFVLPLLMGVSMFVQQSLNPAPQDPTQAKVMKFMPVIFTVFFLWFPAGLVLYWLVNNLLSIGQQWVITRQIEQAK